jgi:hypothetical protein
LKPWAREEEEGAMSGKIIAIGNLKGGMLGAFINHD